MLLPITIITISMLFSYCFFGKLATESLKKIADCLYEMNWYDLPIDLQKNLILIMVSAQKPIYYHGYGLAVLELETFTKVIIYTF